MRTFDRALTKVLATQADRLWFRALKFVIMTWIWLWVIMIIGYLTLAFFGQVDTPPTFQVPGVPPVPGFNQSEFLGELGDIGVTTTQAIPVP